MAKGKYERYGLFAALALACSLAMADPQGALNLNVTQANIHQTICVAGYSKSVRPPSSYTSKIKRAMVGKDGDMQLYELDHFQPISLGGSPSSLSNLWLQPWLGRCNARDKDRLEKALQQSVCAEAITLDEAHQAIINWRASYKEYFGKEC